MASGPESNQKGHPKVQLAIRFFISAGLMTWLIYMVEWDTVFRLVKEGSPLFFVGAFIVIQLTVASSVWKWQLLILSSVKKKACQHPSLRKLTLYYYIGLFFNNFLPGSVGGDVIRIMFLGKNIGMAPAATSVAFERLTSGGALTAIVLFSSLFMDSVRPFLVPIYAVTVIVIVLFLAAVVWMKRNSKRENNFSNVTNRKQNGIQALISKVRITLAKITGTTVDYRSEGWMWWGAIAILSLIFQIGLAWINQLLFLGLGIEVPFIDLLVIISVISFITMIPVSLNGIGVREASYVLFFKELGIPNEIAMSVSLLFLILVTISSLVGGLFWLAERGRAVEAIRQ